MSNRTITIGRGANCDIHLDDPNVAERHGILSIDNDMLCLVLTPGCKAYLNDNQVEGKFWLQDSDVVVIGMVRLNLSLIRTVITEGRDPNGLQLYSTIDSIDDLNDAVVVKHNWWPTIIITLIILAIGLFVGNKMVKNQRIREAQEEELRLKQDSLLRSQIMIDSLSNEIKQFEFDVE